MKKTIYLLLLINQQLFAQSNCTNTVSTNWENPVNSNLPYNPSMSGGVDVHYLNYFDWTQEPINYQNMNPVYNYPFYGLKYDSDAYYEYISGGEDMTPKNGWELVNFNLGYYPDLTTYSPAAKQDIPYIILYNRMTGILRVFATYGSGLVGSGMSFDGVRISVSFANESLQVNGNLRLRDGVDKPLDQQTEVTKIEAMAYHTNSAGEWFSADFQMTYDPCICYFPSKFRVAFDFLESLELTLMGRSITVEDEIANGNHLLTNNFLTNFNFDGSNLDDQIIMYKVLDDFIDDYEQRLDAYRAELAAANEINSELERLSVVIKLFKHVVISGGSSVVDDISDAIWYTNALTWAYDLITPDNASDSTIAKTKEKIKTEAKSGIAKLVDLFIQKNYSSQDLPTEPTAPTASFTEMVLQGTIGNTTTIGVPAFYVPGTYGSEGTGEPELSNKVEYPIYNNTLGTFALLNTPEIKAYKNSQLYNQYTESDTIIDTLPFFPGYNITIDTTIKNYRYASWQNNYQFKLDNPLYYVFNPAADIKSHTVKAALVFEGKLTKNPVTTYPDYSGTNNAYIDPVNTTNLNSQDVEVNEYYPVKVSDGKGFNDGQNYCIDGNPNCSYLENNVWETTIKKDSLTFTTDYFPVDAIQPLVFGAGIMNQFYGVYESNHAFSYPATTKGWEFTITGIKLKLLVDVTHNYLNEDASNVTNTWALTYEIDPNDVNWATSELVSNLENSSLNVDSYSEDLILTATVFDGSDVIGCRLDGTHYTCKGWNSVSVIGDLTTANGYTVDIIGGNLVDVSGEVQIDPEINLSIGTVLDYSQPMPVVTNEFLKDYCKHNLNGNFPYYQGNTANKGDVVSGDGDNENTTGSNVVLEENLATVYPVPTTSELNVLVDKKLEIKDIIISDLTGRIIELKSNRITDNHVLLNAESVSSGTYSMKIRTNQGIISKLFIVVH